MDEKAGTFRGAKMSPPKTSEVIAAEHNVSPRTVKRAGQFAAAVDEVKETEPEVAAQKTSSNFLGNAGKLL